MPVLVLVLVPDLVLVLVLVVLFWCCGPHCPPPPPHRAVCPAHIAGRQLYKQHDAEWEGREWKRKRGLRTRLHKQNMQLDTAPQRRTYPPPPCASTAAVPKNQAKQQFNAHPMLSHTPTMAVGPGIPPAGQISSMLQHTRWSRGNESSKRGGAVPKGPAKEAEPPSCVRSLPVQCPPRA